MNSNKSKTYQSTITKSIEHHISHKVYLSHKIINITGVRYLTFN